MLARAARSVVGRLASGGGSRLLRQPLSSLAARGGTPGKTPPTPNIFWWPHLAEVSTRPTIVSPSEISWSEDDEEESEMLQALLAEIDRAPNPNTDGGIVDISSELTLEFDLPADFGHLEEVRAPEAHTPDQPQAPPAPKSWIHAMPKRTWQPNRLKRARSHGFLKRMSTKAGRRILERRRAKARRRISHR